MTRIQTFSIIALFIAVVSLLATPVSAELIVNTYTNSFSATSPNNEQIKLCACETKVDRVIVENTGQFVADFSTQIQSLYPTKIRVVGGDFQLAPGRFKEILIYIEDSCAVRGEFPYDITVTNSYGRTQVLHRSIRVDMCQTTQLDVAPYNLNVGLCKPATYKTTITNVGTFADSFTLDFGPYNDQATLANKAVFLQAGQSYTQNVTFQFACADYGTKTIPFVVIADKNGIGASTYRDFTITNQYNFALDLNEATVCAKTTTSVPFSIDNVAGAPDTITLTANAPSFVSIPGEIAVAAYENKHMNMTVAPAQPGVYKFSILAMDAYGGVQKQRDMTLNVNNCYDVAAQIRTNPTEPVTSFVTGPVQTCCGAKTFYVNVRNNGDVAQRFELSVDGPSIFSLDETTVSLSPGQNINVPLRATLPCVDQRFDMDVIVNPVGMPQLNTSAHLTVDSQTVRTCHMVQIDEDELAIRQDATIIPVIVKQTGSEGGNYTITSNSTLFSVQEQNITLQPGDQRAIHLVSNGNLTSQEIGRYVVSPTFTLQPQGLAYNEEVGVMLRGKSFLEQFSDWLHGTNCSAVGTCGWAATILFIALVAAIIALFLLWSGKTLFPDGLNRKTLFMLKTLLLVLIAIFLVLMVFLKAPSDAMRYEHVANSNATTIEWYQNEQFTMDMGKYFSDPDKDTLRYVVTQPRDIKVGVENSTLTLIPDHNFVGENTMIITANDQHGGLTNSPVFVLRVIPRKDLGFWQWVEQWCAYLLIIEMITLLLVLFLCILTIKEHRPRPYANNVLVVVDNGAKKTSAPTKRKSARKTTRAATRIVPTRLATTSRVTPIVRRTQVVKSKAIVPLPLRKAPVKSVALARGRQVVSAARTTKPVLREFKGTGQTVNIAVAPQAAVPPQFVAVPGVKQSEIVYVGAKGGNTVHTPYCMNARRIPRNKRVAFTTKKEAINAGLVPCRMCRPFEGGI